MNKNQLIILLFTIFNNYILQCNESAIQSENIIRYTTSLYKSIQRQVQQNDRKIIKDINHIITQLKTQQAIHTSINYLTKQKNQSLKTLLLVFMGTAQIDQIEPSDTKNIILQLFESLKLS